METEFNKLNISIHDINCSYCKECDPFRIMEGWTSGNPDIDKLIKDTIYNIRYDVGWIRQFLEWVPFERFTDIEEIGEGGFAKVYSAIWIDRKSEYHKNNDGSYVKEKPKPRKVALKKLSGSQNISDKYLNELKIHWNLFKSQRLRLFGLTKDPETKEFMMILKFANDNGNFRDSLSNKFNDILWENKIKLLYDTLEGLQELHELGYFHKDFHSGNILRVDDYMTFVSVFGLSGPTNDQKSDDKIYGVLPYIVPEVLNGESYTSSSDIYSFGVVMAELSSGKPPFYNKKHDLSLALAIYNGLRPEFGKGAPEFYKKLAYKCMSSNSIERPTTKDLLDILNLLYDSIQGSADNDEKFGYKGKEIKVHLKRQIKRFQIS
ncbi:hypothetical protein RclHR1_01110025 [Rhizophagus clarus]|uniref:Kinase-like domain-containing protein n=1 Tax=Rhizophagus clarus TaxID=94130 RepID=A0A2Z6Q3K2_9GLOM|nr:hypothetical protein RclHR1_01110025 [Rhizophagus clarus]GES74564.1 kinase-like domain-containing protein [Rhizophagus clarus]